MQRLVCGADVLTEDRELDVVIFNISKTKVLLTLADAADYGASRKTDELTSWKLLLVRNFEVNDRSPTFCMLQKSRRPYYRARALGAWFKGPEKPFAFRGTVESLLRVRWFASLTLLQPLTR